MSLVELGGKPEGYYEQDRAELVRLLPWPLGRVLDVGCGAGGTAGPLRAAGAERLVGIELDPDAAERARQTFDAVHTGRAEEAVAGLEERFDTILCYDLLEHLTDPAALLVALGGVAAERARLHVSVPNARHWTLARDLVLRGTFGYGEAGHRDKTHLRWFTRRDLVGLLEATAWPVVAVQHGELRAVSRLAARLTRGLSVEFLVYQLAALAQRSS
ncbi:MAG TPA: class I SAM-dependent methyltransferase [Gaiellaceae bacterium]|nr:class I SAM-dependent methyltransferase [Gaiellaceae bacterium]